MSSELLYPIMPLYLKSIGFSIVLIGLLEGIAEASAGLSKGYFGKWSDESGKRLPFVRLGYFLSAISKPLMVVFVFPFWVFCLRTIDRLGKGIRTGARDAILANESTKENKGKVFGFHRSMDTIGAVVGPSLGLMYLYFHPAAYKTLFVFALIPGLLAVAISLLLKEKKFEKKRSKNISFFSFLDYWKYSTKSYRQLVKGLLLFTLINSSDVFLLMKAKSEGMDDTWVIGLYIFYNLIYALAAYPLGLLADKIGLKKMYTIGICLFAMVYIGMGTFSHHLIIGGLFLIYGLFAAATEGISKAWISNHCNNEDTGTAIGTYAAFQSIFSLLASVLAGIIWMQLGSNMLFLFAGISSIVVAMYLFRCKFETEINAN
jgi:MFS family permease